MWIAIGTDAVKGHHVCRVQGTKDQPDFDRFHLQCRKSGTKRSQRLKIVPFQKLRTCQRGSNAQAPPFTISVRLALVNGLGPLFMMV